MSTDMLRSMQLEEILKYAIRYCNENNMENPVDVLRYIQCILVQGRPLDIEAIDSTIEGETNYVVIDRHNILESSFEEIRALENLRLTLEVQFYEESAVDLGGPRKEFFGTILRAIADNYFEPIRPWSDDYETIGQIIALSILQNGPLPSFLTPEICDDLLYGDSPRSFVKDLRKGINALGLQELVLGIPCLKFLFYPGTPKPVTLKAVTNLFTPEFSPEGSNSRSQETKVFMRFIKYLREVAGGRRGQVTLRKILEFATGSDEEPILGYRIKPSLVFVTNSLPSFIPMSNTCINRLTLVKATNGESLPTDDVLFNLFDYAFSNNYFGLQ
ncbi:unnamed protein product [Mytilus coruscus]|uniref:HECT-type E3 ubiquitin transferase n=1 Tax=Mytilus coruscus TaxID=42192 RepID=A0A6J8A4T6_MYTCO|nr:unnamed protein product [Mytilus coruscus]